MGRGLICIFIACSLTILLIIFFIPLPATPSLSLHPTDQLYVGILLSTQPEFITGIEDVSLAKSNAFGAMGMFFAVFALSVVGILRTSPNEKEDLDAAEGYQLSSVGQSEYGSSRYD